jgi:4-carboxymuconolactone decarboxylase
MRFRLLCASVIGLAGVAGGLGIARAQAPSAAAAPEAQTQKAPPTLEELRRAVSSLRGDRIKRPTSYDELTSEQKAFVNGILSGPRRGIDGALGIMMSSPVMGDLAQKAIAYARFNPSVPPKLNELAILIGARAWTAQYAWYVHHRAALSAGLSEEVIEGVRLGKRPATMEKDVEAVYNFCTELLTARQMSDATLQAVRTTLGGDKGVVDLVATLGFYQFVAMLMDVDRLPLPPNVQPELLPLN